MMQLVNPKHHYQIKRRSIRLGHRCIRRDQLQLLIPRPNLLHFVEQNLLARTVLLKSRPRSFCFMLSMNAIYVPQ